MELHLPTHVIDTLNSALEKKLADPAAYIFGHQARYMTESIFAKSSDAPAPRHHIYVLVFARNASHDLAAGIPREVSATSGGKISLTLLLHKRKALSAKSDSARWFYGHVVGNGMELIKPKEKLQLPAVKPLHNNARDTQKFWYKCEAVASVYLGSAVQSQHQDVELVKVSMLHQAMEFVALGLVRLFIGYTPNHHSLHFLLDLCAHFTDLPDRVFPSRHDKQDEVCNVLFASPAMLRQWDRLELGSELYGKLLDACTLFFETARAIAVAQLKYMQSTQN